MRVQAVSIKINKAIGLDLRVTATLISISLAFTAKGVTDFKTRCIS